MAQSQNVIKNESHVAPYEGAGAIETAYKKKMMRSVVFIDTISDDGKGSGLIVGLPRSQPMLMTCHHVIPSKEVARKSTISFDREDSSSPGVPVSGAELFDLDSEDSFVTSDTQGMDYTIIGLNPDKIPQDDGKREPFYLHKYQRTLTGEYSLRKGNNVYLIHYPHIDGTFYRQESAFVIQFLSGYLFGHRAETHGGSSGCPVLKEFRGEWVLAGLHRGSMPTGVQGRKVNVATHVEAIHKSLTDIQYKPQEPDWKEINKESSAGSVKDSTVSKEEPPQPSSNRDILEKEVRKHKGYQAILRNYVANKAGMNWKTLVENLDVSKATAESYLANNFGNIKDAAAGALNHWAKGNTSEKAIWSVLLKAMRNSDMEAEATDLEEKLLQ